MRGLLRVFVPFAALILVLYAWIDGGSGPPRVPTPVGDPTPAMPREPAQVIPPEATTGTLVIRVKTESGGELPEKTRAGYSRFGGADRLRTAGPDGTFRFTDAPVGRIEVIAEAPGYERGRVALVVVAGISNEAVLTLTADKFADGR